MTPTPTSTIRATAVALRSYCRPVKEGSPIIETWELACDRVIGHQQWLWERALKEKNKGKERPLNEMELAELQELRKLLVDHKVGPAGRTMWLGGTNLSRTLESTQFNCSFSEAATLFDVVDMFWLLLQGCGVGFSGVVGSMHGFKKELEEIEVIRSTRTMEDWKAGQRGQEHNTETFDEETGVWTIIVGDSAKAWAKAVGKLLVGKYAARKLILSFEPIRVAGVRLKGYGWISSGDEKISQAFYAIAKILSERTDQLLTKIDILDIMNWLGTVLSSRRSAEICLMDYGDLEWKEFAAAKKDYWPLKKHRAQSNNSLVFWQKPTKQQLEEIFRYIQDSGGAEPGFVNGAEARRRAPWFAGMNPCVEIILANKGFCNLAEVNLAAFRGDMPGLKRALHLAGRMNYRQTCVKLNDGILQEAWDTNNSFLHLCGVGLTGVTARMDLSEYDLKSFKNITVSAAHGMARELGLPLPKNVTCVKPSGTMSKVMGSKEWGEVPEGAHCPEGRFIFNEILHSKHDPLVARFEAAGYVITPHPSDTESVLIRFPVKYDNVPFVKKKITHGDGTTEVIEVNGETAIEQLERYRKLMTTWAEQNVSITIKYDPAEIPAIIKWILKNWDSYVGVSFLYRNDPTRTAKEMNFPYLPQTVVSEKTYDAYVKELKEVDLNGITYSDLVEQADCAGGACPLR